MNKPHQVITIPKPCHEGWHNMLPGEKGRYCQSCSKTVIDFSQMTDAEVIETMRLQPNGCGHFAGSQLNRPLVPYVARHRQQAGWPRALLMAMLSVFSFKNESQGAVKPAVEISKPLGGEASAFKINGPDVDTSKRITFSGVVLDDSTHQPLFAAIYLVQDGKRIKQYYTDSASGRFSFSTDSLEGKSLAVYASDHQLETIELTPDHNALTILLHLKIVDFSVDGGYSIDYEDIFFEEGLIKKSENSDTR